jgi:serine/threonine protein kinase
MALAGSSTGCVGFMGVTALYKSRLNDAPSGIGRDEDRRLLLVFERATEGSLLEYLDRVLPGLSFTHTWDTIIGIISNVANGLNSLHKHNIIHRLVPLYVRV